MSRCTTPWACASSSAAAICAAAASATSGASGPEASALAREQLVCDPGRAVGRAVIDHAHDVRRRQRRGHARLGQEALHAVAVDRGGEDLHRDRALEVELDRTVDHAVPAGSDARLRAEAPDAIGRERKHHRRAF
jgi:hypothetical protein